MKQWPQFLIFSITFLLVVGCSQPKNKGRSEMDRFMSDSGKLKVVSTTGIIADMVRQIGGDHIDHVTLIAGELDPHSYELVKGDDEKLKFSQLIFYNGLGLEHGASLHYALQHHPQAVSLGDGIVESYPDAVIKVDGVTDPHIWMDVSLWEHAIDSIVDSLSSLDAEHASVYKQNGEEVRAKMQEVDQNIYTSIQQVAPEKRYLVTSHDAFNYFAKRYLADLHEDWHPRVAAPEGLSPEGQLSTVHIAQIIDHLALYHIQVVFPESNVSRDSLKKITLASQEKGLTVAISKEVLYGDALGGIGSGSETYLKMMRHNAEVLVKEWQ